MKRGNTSIIIGAILIVTVLLGGNMFATPVYACTVTVSGKTGVCLPESEVCQTEGSGASTDCTPNEICCPTGTPPSNNEGANCGENMTKIAGICVPTQASTGLSDTSVFDIVKNFMNWLLLIFGFIAIIGFVISGIQYLTSAGQEDMAEAAKRNMKYSIIGVIVALSAFVIIQAIDAALNATNVIF